jgi:uncharacterized NAD-dependent epimerase/dehydratase family protein
MEQQRPHVLLHSPTEDLEYPNRGRIRAPDVMEVLQCRVVLNRDEIIIIVFKTRLLHSQDAKSIVDAAEVDLENVQLLEVGNRCLKLRMLE